VDCTTPAALPPASSLSDARDYCSAVATILREVVARSRSGEPLEPAHAAALLDLCTLGAQEADRLLSAVAAPLAAAVKVEPVTYALEQLSDTLDALRPQVPPRALPWVDRAREITAAVRHMRRGDAR